MAEYSRDIAQIARDLRRFVEFVTTEPKDLEPDDPNPDYVQEYEGALDLDTEQLSEIVKGEIKRKEELSLDDVDVVLDTEGEKHAFIESMPVDEKLDQVETALKMAPHIIDLTVKDSDSLYGLIRQCENITLALNQLKETLKQDIFEARINEED